MKLNFWNFWLQKTRVTILLTIVLVVFGWSGYQNIARENTPEVEVPNIIVQTVWPGASAVDVEKLVTEVIEREVKSLDHLVEYTSKSLSGLSIINVEFEIDSDQAKNLQNLTEAVDDAERELPDGILDSPDVEPVSISSTPILSFNLSGDFAFSELKLFAETLQAEFETIAGVDEANILGLPEEEYHIYLDPIRLRGLQLSVEEVAQAIQSQSADLPLGQLKLDGETINVRVQGELKRLPEFLALPIANRQGQIVTLDQVADVRFEFDEIEVETLYSSGAPFQRTLTIDVMKAEAKTNILRVVEDITATVEKARQDGLIPDELLIDVVFDGAEDIEKSLGQLTGSAVQTVLLISLVLLIALGWRESLVAFVVIPLCLLVTVGVLYMIGETFNFMSLFALVLSLGLLVDNAIIMTEGVSENINKKRLDPNTAGMEAIKSFRAPVTTGTLTTVFAFLPMLFLISGVSGDFISVLPITVTIVLVVSLFVSVFLLPAYASWFFTLIKPRPHSEAKWLIRLKAWYDGIIQKILKTIRGAYLFILGCLVVLIGSFSLFPLGLVPFEIFPPEDTNYLALKVELPAGSELAETKAVLKTIEPGLLESFTDPAFEGAVKSIVATVGQISPFDQSARNQVVVPESEVLGVSINFVDGADRELTSAEITQLVRENLEPLVPSFAEMTFSVISGGPPTGSAAIEVELASEDLDHLDTLVDELKQRFETIELNNGATLANIRDDRGDSLPELTWELDRQKMQFFGLTLNQIRQTLFASLQGFTVLTITENGEEIDVEMRLNYQDDLTWKNPASLEILQEIPIKTPTGNYVTLQDIAEIKIEAKRSEIGHLDGKRTARVLADIDGKATATQFAADVNTQIDALDLWSGDVVVLGGDNRDSQELVQEMAQAMLMAVFLIALILVLQFNSFRQSLVIVLVLPFTLAPVFLGFFLTQTPISFPTMIGIVALVGIIVNDAIVLIDQYNINKRDRLAELSDGELLGYQDRVKVLIDACNTRLQPILITSATTVLGLLPLALSDPVWRGLGFAIIYGMAASTILTLILVPCLILMMDDLGARLKRLGAWGYEKLRR